MCPREERILAWQRLARDLPLAKLDRMTETAALSTLPERAAKILAGGIRGRIVVDVTA